MLHHARGHVQGCIPYPTSASAISSARNVPQVHATLCEKANCRHVTHILASQINTHACLTNVCRTKWHDFIRDVEDKNGDTQLEEHEKDAGAIKKVQSKSAVGTGTLLNGQVDRSGAAMIFEHAQGENASDSASWMEKVQSNSTEDSCTSLHCLSHLPDGVLPQARVYALTAFKGHNHPGVVDITSSGGTSSAAPASTATLSLRERRPERSIRTAQLVEALRCKFDVRNHPWRLCDVKAEVALLDKGAVGISAAVLRGLRGLGALCMATECGEGETNIVQAHAIAEQPHAHSGKNPGGRGVMKKCSLCRKVRGCH